VQEFRRPSKEPEERSASETARQVAGDNLVSQLVSWESGGFALAAAPADAALMKVFR